jgi:hypothetical protein
LGFGFVGVFNIFPFIVQVANVMSTGMEWNVLRIGAMTFLSVGQLLPHQLANFHTEDFIYPIGDKLFTSVLLSVAATVNTQINCILIWLNKRGKISV